MTQRLLPVAMLLAFAGCGSDGDGGGGLPPTVSTPPPPVTVPLDGPYDLVVSPAPGCNLPGAPYTVRVTVTTFVTGSGTQLRGTLPTGGDFLALDRVMPVPEPGELLAIHTVGAYGFVMASTYNARPRPAEVLVSGADARLIRRRETYDDLMEAEEELLPE